MSNKDTLVFENNTDTIVTLMYDQPKTGTNNYGAWYLYGVQHNGEDTSFFATETLHSKLKYYQNGDVINIRKEQSDGKFKWNIIPQEGTKAKTSASDIVKKIDDRTHDIHKQVCLKLAVDMVAKKDKHELLTGTELTVIEANMKQLLVVLEGTGESGLEEETSSPKTNDNPPF